MPAEPALPALPALPDLPAPIRRRVVALAAESLPQLSAAGLPAALRRVADFSAPRRARQAGTQIAAALDTDADFRERVAAAVRFRYPHVGASVADGVPLPAADPVEVAALAYLLRPDGWVERIQEAIANKRPSGPAVAAADAGSGRSQDRLERVRDELREVRERGRQRLAEAKAENGELRRRLAETRQQLREARSAESAARVDADATTTRLVSASAAADALERRLRGRVAELEAQLAEVRRGDRGGRDAVSTRVRLLLETLEGAVQGLRRELALPAGDVLPADTVDASRAGGAGADQASGRSLRADGDAPLAQLLALPRTHLVVDGYNVTKTGYPSLALNEQRTRLLRDLAPLVAQTGVEVTVAFDGASLPHLPPVAGPRGVRVLFSSTGTSADELIGELVEAEPRGRPVVVVSADREVADRARAAGARAVSAASLLGLLARS